MNSDFKLMKNSHLSSTIDQDTRRSVLACRRGTAIATRAWLRMRSFRPPLHLIYRDLKGAPPSSPNPSHPDTNMEHALQALTLLAYSESAIWKSAEESWKLIWPWCSFFADTFILNQRQLPRTVEGVNFRDDALCTVYPLLANLIKLPGNVAFRAVIRPFSRISHMLTKSWLYAAENHHISLPYISMAWVKHQSLSMNEVLGEWDSAEFEEIAYASPHYLAVTALRTVIYETLQPKIDIMSMNGAFSIIAESQMHNELRQALLAHELPRWIAYAMRHIISQSATEYLNLTSSLSVHSDHMESVRNIAFLLSEIVDSVTWIIQALDEQLILTIFKSKRSWGFCALHKPTAMSLEQVYAKLLRALVPFLYNRSVFRAVVHSIRRVEHLGLDADMPKVFSKTTSEVWDAWHALRVSVANMRKTRSDYKSNGFTACSNVRQCPKLGSLTPQDRLLRCSACLLSFYCSRECQRQHWSKHRDNCKVMHARRKEGHPTVATDAERILLFSWFLQTDVMSRSEDIKELQAKWKRQGLPPSEPPYFVVHEIDYRVYPPRMGMGPGERWEKEASPEHWESIREEMRENRDYILVFAIFPAGASSSVSALRAIPLECPGCDDPNCASRQASMT